jgi:competence ComEA-like helix-hairpin-helix protein
MPAKPIPLVNLNMADTILLDSLRGIGAKTASRIVRYRDRLGGFHNLNQLKEIFGIDSTMFSAITIQCEVDTVTSSIRKIPMAEVELDALSLHPYISRRQAGILLAWRRQRGIKNGNDLILSKALSPEEAKRLEPYLIF